MEDTQKVSLAAFLAARLNEDYLQAYMFHNDSQWGADMLASLFKRHVSDPVIHHIARYDPDSALRDAEADRRLLAAYAEVARYDTDDPEPEFASGRAAGLGEAVRIRAERFSDHPDYRQEWKWEP